jgi:eukaryotic-like serine/threonine-protein kinase
MAGERPSQKYQLGGRIGGGGMAEVFEATLVGAAGFLRPVAVKRIQPSLSSDPVFGEMFVNEARIASLLHHPNIAAVLDFDRDEEGRYFLVMELIRGIDLRRLMDTGRLPISIAVHVAAEMLRGLAYAHELEQDGMRLGIVHRDISPHNVMTSWDGAIKVVDFGIAKAMAATGISRSGTIKGKVAYMSPEQASALELDGRTDVFAVGVVLHEILVGDRLFRGNTEPEILARLLTQPIPRPVELAPNVPPDLDGVVMKMLERDRDARYLSAHAALEALLGTSATSARAGLELEELLADRFPGEAPRRRAGALLAETPGASPVGASAATLAARPAAAAPFAPTTPLRQPRTGTAPVPAAAAAYAPTTPLGQPRTGTAPVPAADTPSVFRERAAPWATPARRAGRGRPWRAGALLALVAAAVTSGLLIARERNADRGALATAADASVPPAAQPRPPEPRTVVPTPPAAQPRPPEPRTVVPTPPAATPDAGAAAADAATAPREDDIAAGRDPDEADTDRAPAPREPERARVRDPHRAHQSRRADPGYLDVAVDPWANLTVDGKSYGQTPKTITLSPGPHRVLLRNSELDKSESLTVKIKSGETKSLGRTWH